MLTRAEIDALACNTVADMGDIFYDATGDEDRGPIETERTAEQAVVRAIEQALDKVPRVSNTLIKKLEDLLYTLRHNDISAESEDDALAEAIDILKKLTPPDPPKPYSVLVMLPLKFAAEGAVSNLIHVEATDAQEAERIARQQCWDELRPRIGHGDILEVALICEGHINDIKE